MKAPAPTVSGVLARALELCRSLSDGKRVPAAPSSPGAFPETSAGVAEEIRLTQGHVIEISRAIEEVAMRIGPLAWGAAMEAARTGEEARGEVSSMAAEARALSCRIGKIAQRAEAVSRRLERIAARAEGEGLVL